MLNKDNMIIPINWNKIEDEKDLEVWETTEANHWVSKKIPLSNDIASYNTLTDDEKWVTMRVFGGLTLLDTLQSSVGAVCLMKDSITPHEEAVYANFTHLEAIHAKSYSYIFSTLCSTEEINDIFRWTMDNPYLQKKQQMILANYNDDDPLMKKVSSVFLESFLFYSGFYLSFWLASRAKLTNTADIIRLILRDECVTQNHDLLTPTGWKPVADITTSDLVAQYNMVDGTTEFVNPVAISSHMADYIWKFETEQGHVKLEVSPRHRMLFERRPYDKVTESTVWKPYEIEAEDVTKTNLSPYSRVIHGAPKKGGRDKMTDVEKLYVAICADGSFDTTTKNSKGDISRNGSICGTIPCKFVLSKSRKIDRLFKLAEAVNWDVKEFGYRQETGNIKERKNIVLRVPVNNNATSKRLSNLVNLNDVSGAWCREFINEIAEWDGHRVKDSDRITWGSVIPEEADFVQAVAALAGYRTHRTIRPDYRSDKYSDYHRIQINIDPYSGAQKIKKTQHPGEMVYGVQVPSTYLLTRNGNSVTVTGNSVHGHYIGHKFQIGFAKLSADEQQAYTDRVYELLQDLYDNEILYTSELYDRLGLTEDVKAFLRYNANKALANLGFDPLFPEESCVVSSAIMASLSPVSDETHDFFSQSGSAYVISEKVTTTDDDWDL